MVLWTHPSNWEQCYLRSWVLGELAIERAKRCLLLILVVPHALCAYDSVNQVSKPNNAWISALVEHGSQCIHYLLTRVPSCPSDLILEAFIAAEILEVCAPANVCQAWIAVQDDRSICVLQLNSGFVDMTRGAAGNTDTEHNLVVI